MAGIDKIAIGFTIAIVAIGVGFAFVGDSIQSSPVASAPISTQTNPSTEKPQVQSDPFADIASKVKEQDKVVVEDTEPEMAEPEMAEPEMAEPEMAEPEMAEPEMAEPVSGPQTVSVQIPTGTAVPGCEETNECYLPYQVTINVGDTVNWINEDTAAHTVTGGSPADGPSGIFDSSLVLGGAQYSHTFEDAGSFDYFCMVHPWMVGNVMVN